MNKLLSFIIAASIVFTFYACSDDDESGTPSGPAGPSGATAVTATIDGAEWTAFNDQIIAGVDSTGDFVMFAVGAAGNDTALIVLGTESPSVGTYQVDTVGSNGAAVDLFFPGISGSITITAHNANTNAISGTFNFVTGEFFGNPARTVSNGVFNNVTYTED